MQSSTSSANSRAAKGGGRKDEEHKRHEIVTIALLPAGKCSNICMAWNVNSQSNSEPASLVCLHAHVLSFGHVSTLCSTAWLNFVLYSMALTSNYDQENSSAGVHEAFRASSRPVNSKPLQPSHDSASSLHQTQVGQNATVSRLNPANLRAVEESSTLSANLSRTGSALGRHTRRILQAAHLSSSAPSAAAERTQSHASASSADTDAHTRASSVLSSLHSPANNPAAAAVRKLAAGLKATLQELFGATLHLSASTIAMNFPTAFDRLRISFYRSKITSWMAAQEEDYRSAIVAETQ